MKSYLHYGSAILTIIFILCLLLIYLYARYSLKNEKNAHFVEYAPSLLTSLGIFGTFLGIVIGLLNFNPQNIDGSIQQLLEGLKIAFITSIGGIAGSIAIKWEEVHCKDGTKSSKATALDIGPEEIHHILKRQLASTAIIQNAVVAECDQSIAKQIQALKKEKELHSLQKKNKEEREEFQNKLFDRLDKYAEIISKSPTDQVIETLREVISQFNQKITEQFGDNFKHLDESVKKLVVWQAQYMVQMEQMKDQYALGISSLEASKIAVQEIRIETARIPGDMASLADVLLVNQQQVQGLSRHLDVFVQMRDKAVEAIPEIQQQLEAIGKQLCDGAESVNSALIQGADNFSSSVKKTNNSMREVGNSVIEVGESITEQSESISNELSAALELLVKNTAIVRTQMAESIDSVMSDIQKNINKATTSTNQAIENNSLTLDKALKKSVKNIEDVQDAHTDALKSMVSSMTQSADKSLHGVEQAVQEAVNLTNKAVNSQIHQLDEALSKQLNAALEELGAALGTIANHLIENYQKNTRNPKPSNY